MKYDKEIKPNVSDFKNFIDSGFLIKDNIWQYENEFRILLFNKNNTPEQNGNEIVLNEIGLQLTEIIFGVNCNEKDHELVQSIIVKNKDVYRDVRFYKMELNDPSANFFQLQKVELDNSKYHIK
ncbi:MAG: hypothetical protein ORN85_02540 [Sediminibacterium sp.]|nr:hypothetical protein [Sediminibacterium sp.]